MHLAYLAVSVILLGGVKEPVPQTIPQGVYNEKGCEQWKRNMEGAKRPLIDPGTSRPVLSQQFVCQPVDLDDLQKMPDRARKG
ncbi:hypothetical protein U8P73_36165 (plasmid) [Rhizobium beringeri]|uniref:hypothetical protein n=1 Tax=Rhizobium beringeri TaxID=3019934 RepID=UPI002DDCCC58|nr:hypothetical protein [Rhizobium beringeri]WSG93586.1 hypothetical protein U8P73_36165 [Rhizobium beringeri]